MQYRAEIDGLRAVAVVPVILFHAGFSLFSGGFVGVDVFFVISGYLITSIILAEMDKGEFSLTHFYERRARRILPALFFVMAACIPFAWFWLMPRDLINFAESVVATSTFSSNILFWSESGYFATSAELKPLLHTWSLAVEEQYYIIFPLILMAFWRFGKRGLFAITAIMFVYSLSKALGDHADPSAAFYLLPSRGWEILLGAFLAFYFNASEKRLPHFANEALALTGVALVGYAMFAFDKNTPFPSLYTLIPTVGTALIILSATPQTWVGRFLSNRLFVGIGMISYSMYLWHQPLLAFAKYRYIGEMPIAFTIALCLASVGLAYVSWRCIEAPFRTKKIFDRQQIFRMSMAGFVAFIGIGAVSASMDGFSNRFSGKMRLAVDTAVDSPLSVRQRCHTKGVNYLKPSKSCTYFGEEASWAVIGDSHAIALSYSLAQMLKEQDEGVRQFSFSSCAPSYGDAKRTDPCAKWTEEAVDLIVMDEDIENVVLSYRIALALHGFHQDVYPAIPDKIPAEQSDRVWQSFTAMMQKFLDSGKSVTLVLQAPEVRADVHQLMRFVPSSSGGNVESVPQDWWRARMRYVTERLDEVPAEVQIIDPVRTFCSTGKCLAIENGTSLYIDTHHVSLAGADKIASEILNRPSNRKQYSLLD